MFLRRFIRRLVICARRATLVAVIASVLWFRGPIPTGPLPAVASFNETQTGDVPVVPSTGQVVIEEIAWAGSSLSTADEWIELANLGDATATVAGWVLRGAGEGGRQIFLPPDAVIAPRSTYLVANYPNTDEKSALNVTVDLATTTVSLSNSALGVELVDADGVTVDRAGDGGAPLAGSSSPKATMIRVNATTQGDAPDAWTAASSSVGYDDGIADMGTPGTCDLWVAEEMPPDSVVDPTGETDATTTEDIITNPTDESATTTTEVTALETPTTTEPLVEAATTTDPVVTIAEPESVPSSQPPVPNPLSYSLSEAMSNPASGPEWIELAIADVNATATDRVLELWDAVGRIATIAKGTAVTAPGFLVVALTSARLNNGGDRLELRELSQTVTDATTIPELEDGVAWARRLSDGTWTETPVATPGAVNSVPSPAPAETTQPLPLVDVSAPAVTSAVATSTSAQTIPSAVKQPTARQTTTKSVAAKQFATAKIVTPATKTAATGKTSAVPSSTKTKTTAPKPTVKGSPIPTLYPFSSMFENDANGVRVRVTGTVGSVPRLLGSTHAFILLGEDGRGVIVYLPKHLNVPPLGATVRVMGTLSSTYKGPELRMKTTDVWQTVIRQDTGGRVLATPPAPRTRSVELLAPAEEDSWSLVAATGTVKDVKARGFVINVDGLDVQINIPPAVKFRAERLMKGDVVRVTGLLDLRRDNPALLPRTADEIEIVTHAPSSIAPVSEDHGGRMPDWTPFGAAAGAVALTGAAKRLRELLRRRRLEALAAKLDVAA
ncbi:MAG TPA: lamin tail domain-containing protein [Candidatus Methylomirabilis sp.]|nr:lamin tail domain-containing protein [Candidatus Methylomirabilis sp.]